MFFEMSRPPSAPMQRALGIFNRILDFTCCRSKFKERGCLYDRFTIAWQKFGCAGWFSFPRVGKSDAWHEASLCIKLDGLLHNCTVDMLLFTFSALHQDNPLSDFGFLPSLVKWSNFFFFFSSFFFEIKHLAFTHWTRRDYTKCIRKEVALKISCLGLVLPYLAIIQKMSNHIFWALFDCCELVACIFKWMLKVEEKNGSFLVWESPEIYIFFQSFS